MEVWSGVVLFSLVLAVLFGGCLGNLEPQQIKAKSLALDFIERSPTYQYDGSGIKFSWVAKGECDGCRDVEYTFTSSHSGYGDRIDNKPVLILSPHRAVISVRDGYVVRGTLDERWDMFSQELLEFQ